jgi:hypothetical protein
MDCQDLNGDGVITVPQECAGYPIIISPDFCYPFQVKFSPASTGQKTATMTIRSSDIGHPALTVQANGKGTQPNIATAIANSGNFGDVCLGKFSDLPLTINNPGGCNLSVTKITSSNSTEFIVPNVTSPLTINPGGSTTVPIRFQPISLGAKSSDITIVSNAPSSSTVVHVSGNVPPGQIKVTGSTDFGNVCAETQAEKTISICNMGKCDLGVTSVAFDPACDDFEIINNPFPATVSPDSCVDIVIRFTPKSVGPKACTLKIRSDDPDSPIITQPVTANTPVPSIDVPPDLSFLPEVIQSIGSCQSLEKFPITNTGKCNLKITNIAIGGENVSDYALSCLPSYPIILQPGHSVGEGDLKIVFAPTELDRNRKGKISVTYESDPFTPATADVTRDLCGEGVRTGARVLVTVGGVPVNVVKKIQIQRINSNRNKKIVDTVDVAQNVPLTTETPGSPCQTFQYHREYGTVSNPLMLLPGSYNITATVGVNGKNKSKTVAFDVSTCDFNPNIIINF